jgi:hypothetical protein
LKKGGIRIGEEENKMGGLTMKPIDRGMDMVVTISSNATTISQVQLKEPRGSSNHFEEPMTMSLLRLRCSFKKSFVITVNAF